MQTSKRTIDLKFNRYFTELDTKAEQYFNKMEAIAEDHHKGILDSVYKAISDSFWNQTVLKNQIEWEEQYSDPSIPSFLAEKRHLANGYLISSLDSSK